MFSYIFGVALRDHVVGFHFEPQGNSIWRYFWKKLRKKWQFFFFEIQLLYRKRILRTEQSGTKWHKIVELSKYALVIIKIQHGGLKIAAKAKKMLKNDVLSE